VNEKDPNSFLAVGALAGATIIKVLNALMRRQHNETEEIRKELRDEVKRLSKEISNLHHDLVLWKDKYYKLAEENGLLKAECALLKREVTALKSEWASSSQSAEAAL
jgi:predicted nuclease with TOPRIM domain